MCIFVVRNQVAAIAIAAMILLVAGCASTNNRGLKTRAVGVSAFAEKPATTMAAAPSDSAEPMAPESEPAGAAVARQPASAPSEPSAATEPATTSTAAASPTATSARPAPAPKRPGERLINPGDVIVIDSVVGQVSGRPIFADALLEPIADQLRQESAQLSAREFTARAAQVINNRLTEVVLTELFLAEAEASLTAEQQQGLLAFLRNLQERTIASGQGSRIVTEQRLMDELGMTIEQYTERERNTLLIAHLINRKISPRVIVSWKDVEREYERRKAEFNPPATVTLKRIRLAKPDQAGLIEQVKSRLHAGESFDDISASLDPGFTSTLDPLPMGPAGITDVPIGDAYKSALTGISAGQTTAPIEFETRTEWLHVAAVDQATARSLFDVQRQLIRELEVRRQNEERERYVKTLFARGIHDELGEMSNRAVRVALMRYGK